MVLSLASRQTEGSICSLFTLLNLNNDTAETFSFERAIEDGHIEISFTATVNNPKISAIGIELLK